VPSPALGRSPYTDRSLSPRPTALFSIPPLPFPHCSTVPLLRASPGSP